MQEVIGVKFSSATKVYYFSPKGIMFNDGDGVIVETSRGTEFGTVASANHEVQDSDIVATLKPVIRRATDRDLRQNADNQSKKAWAFKMCHEKIASRKLDMKLIDAEYTFDKTKAIFTFTSEGRIDFRDLVRDLASLLKTRIEMRQIYERDDIKMRGALASCGRVCCCHNHLQDFEKVSIKMAKNQNLSLNPQKISGVCGKLMCCLKYENDYYVETNKLMPKLGSFVKTPLGLGRVDNHDVLKRRIKAKVELEDGSYTYKDFSITELEKADMPDSYDNNIRRENTARVSKDKNSTGDNRNNNTPKSDNSKVNPIIANDAEKND